MNFERTGRKDDLISLCYMMVYLMQRPYKFPNLVYPNGRNNQILNSEANFYFIQTYKEFYSLENLCIQSDSVMLTNFGLEIEKLKYDSRPDYQKLRSILDGLIYFQK